MMLFASCFGGDPAPSKTKRRLSKKMIGNPTNFKMSKLRASIVPRPSTSSQQKISPTRASPDLDKDSRDTASNK
ncbi:hypothetical protein AYI70_g3254 [Smittium culicis]|uniref:Uncharacterized protein n=1 Tax=Smittium culicis TaxID=133412 RepID=A0A1R1Y4M2_9FUNG|nr:hypothetical protein AYI70_g11928 [Smittium culicis]OMJ21799.1 hypothetical protein AYI70_g3254 [Smittium culicis]